MLDRIFAAIVAATAGVASLNPAFVPATSYLPVLPMTLVTPNPTVATFQQPSLGARAGERLRGDQPLPVSCQTIGSVVGGSAIWDGLAGGGFVPDSWLAGPRDGAGGFAAALARCPAAPGGHALLCPVAGAVSFSSEFGAPRSGGRTHQGNDIFARRGTPAIAPLGGQVVVVLGGLTGIGYLLYADDGNTYFGAHLDSSVNLGPTPRRIERGEVLGFVGTTGNAATTPPHLHFEYHPGRTLTNNVRGAVDPYALLSDICRLNRS